SNRIACAYEHSDRHSDEHADADSNSNRIACAYEHSDSHADEHADQDTDQYTNHYPDPDTDTDALDHRDADVRCPQHVDQYAYSNSYPDTSAPPRGLPVRALRDPGARQAVRDLQLRGSARDRLGQLDPDQPSLRRRHHQVQPLRAARHRWRARRG